MATRPTIRPARPDEYEVIATVHEMTARSAYAHIFADPPFPREQALNRWREFPGKILLAEKDGKAVGFVAFDEAELHALYMLPAFQGLGIGSRLLDSAGPVSVLWVLKENVGARRFYEKRGWADDGVQREESGAIEVRYRRREAPVGHLTGAR